MKLLKLTVLYALFFSLVLTTNSCEKESDRRKQNEFVNENIPMNGKESAPQSPSTATGSLSVYYNRRAKTLEYLFTWSGLTGNPTSFGIYGPSPEKYPALVTPSASNPTGLAPALLPISSTGYGTSGTYSGSVILDGTVLKEGTLLNNLYYVRINTAAIPYGEIRGQIKF
jgi:hypothetical protein